MTTNLHTAWARLFVDGLCTAGVRDLVMSPGSRSTALVLAASEHPTLRVHVHVDERVASFFALGQARATGRPTALLCTSGTAGAHWLPAVIEASLTQIPLVCVTADRPWEAYDCAAPQTIDQTDLFGHHVRHRAELGAPTTVPSALRAVQRIAAQAVHRATHPTPGPVHVNARFRKPLEPVRVAAPEAWEPIVHTLLTRGPTRVFADASPPPRDAVAHVADALRHARRPWVLCGPSLSHDDSRDRALRDAVSALCRVTGAALLAEATSNLRFGLASDVLALPSFDAMLRAPSFAARAAPDCILALALPPTGSACAAWVDANALVPRHVVTPHAWPDPDGGAASLTLAEPVAFVRALVDALHDRTPPDDALAWGRSLARAQSLATHAITTTRDDGTLHEGALAARLVGALPEGAVLCLGNSLPARDVDTFTTGGANALRVLHQRGASGIDGIVSGAVGVRSVTATTLPVVAYLGDVSMLHDLGGLAAAARVTDGALVVVVVDNGGGRIFEQLPLGRAAARDDALQSRFQRLFVTPQACALDTAASAFGLRVATPRSLAELDDALREALRVDGATLLVVTVDGDVGRDLRDRTHAAVREALATERASS